MHIHLKRNIMNDLFPNKHPKQPIKVYAVCEYPRDKEYVYMVKPEASGASGCAAPQKVGPILYAESPFWTTAQNTDTMDYMWVFPYEIEGDAPHPYQSNRTAVGLLSQKEEEL